MIKVNKNKKIDKESFPVLMKTDGLIALFCKEKEGIIISADPTKNGFKEGCYYTFLNIGHFRLFKGDITITLENDL